MKKILYLNNYGCDETYIKNCLSSNIPKNHIWGIDYLQIKYNVIIGHIPFYKWNPSNKFTNITKRIIVDIILCIRYWNVDIVYSACQSYLTIFSLLKHLHISKKILIKVIHHATGRLYFPKQYNLLIYISPIIQRLYTKKYPNLHSECIDWGGDSQYFNSKYKKENTIYTFISAGKSHRDYLCLEKAISASTAINKKTIIICDEQTITHPDITCIQSSKKGNDALSYNRLVRYYGISKFMIIPINPNLQNELCGLTSLVDAIQLGIPVLISDNTNIGIDIEQLQLGWVYKAGDIKDMTQKINLMCSITEEKYLLMTEKIRDFSQSHNYENFSKNILQLISNISFK